MLLSVVAASIALVIARQTVLDARSVTSRRDYSAALRAADSTLSNLEAELQADPTIYLKEVLPFERARVCVTGSDSGNAFQPGQAWPAECGAVWGYQQANTPGPVRVELTPPTPSDSLLRARALATFGQIDAGYDAEYILDGANRWVFASTSDISMAAPGAANSEFNLTGGLYSAGEVTLPAGSAVTFDEATVAAEFGFSTAPTDTDVRWYGDAPDPGPPAIRQIRAIQPAPLTAGSLATTVDALENVACPGGTMQEFSSGPHENRTSHLCFVADGATGFLPATGPGVTVPATTQTYMVLPDTPTAGQLTVYVSDTPLDLSETSELLCSPQPGCSLPAHAAADTVGQPNMADNTHPGELDFWTNPATGSALLGAFKVPASGVVAFDADVVVGYCSTSAAEYTTGAACASINGAVPGVSLTTPLTILAGGFEAPADVIVGAPLSAVEADPAAMLALVASDRALIPYFAHPGQRAMTVDADLFGAGLGIASGTPSVGGFPNVLPLTGAGDNDAASSITLTGSMVGRDLQLGISGTEVLNVSYRPEARAASAPHYTGTGAEWVRLKSFRITGDDVCVARQCSNF